MSLRYGVLCLVLLFVVSVLCLKNYETWTLPIKVVSEKETAKKTLTKIEGAPPVVGQKESTAIQSYVLAAERNIFHPERKDFPILTPSMPEAAKKPPARPKIVLYGVTSVGDYQSASIVNPGRPLQKGEREVMTLRVGDRIGDYRLAKILPDRIVMEAPEDAFEVLLYDPNMPKKRIHIKTESKPTTVTSTLPPSAPPPEAPKPAPSREIVGKPPEPLRERPIEAPVPRPAPPGLVPSPPVAPPAQPLQRPRSRMAPIAPPPSPSMEEGGKTE